ncbi:hemerythrin domain-containing protein [Streptomyces fragilis]|uniref:Hemerythrin domain-containing protein n=1 Tax=Streptomyces fragilis TaxID=67301 RepID=A0ABV2YLK5_9ACTN|nr:hemerythrin domain-containing protein [Streptomyces fragilis]
MTEQSAPTTRPQSVADLDTAELGGENSILARQRRDHDELDRMMNAYEQAATDGPERDELWRSIVQLVFSHAFAEETVLWPLLRRVSDDGEALTAVVEEEHQAVNELVAKVEEADPADPRRAEWIAEAFALIRQDIRDEEDELLPLLRAALDDRRLRQVGASWDAVRRGAPTRPHPGIPRRPPGNAVLGVPLSGYDRLRDLGARRPGVLAGAALSVTGAALLAARARRSGR